MEKDILCSKKYTAQKLFVFGVILVRIQSEYRKIRTRITPNMDTFHAVTVWENVVYIITFLVIFVSVTGCLKRSNETPTSI